MDLPLGLRWPGQKAQPMPRGAGGRLMHWRDRSRRRPAFNDPGHAHELTICIANRHPFLQSDLTCGWLGPAIEAARTKHQFALWAYVFMPDHVHLVVFPRRLDYDIEDI